MSHKTVQKEKNQRQQTMPRRVNSQIPSNLRKPPRRLSTHPAVPMQPAISLLQPMPSLLATPEGNNFQTQTLQSPPVFLDANNNTDIKGELG